MKLSIFTDELGVDITEGAAILEGWGLEWIDLRSRLFGRTFEALEPGELRRLKGLIDERGFKVGCLQSSLAKVHMPEGERYEAEKDKLEAVIRAADVMGCRLVRTFFFWQPRPEEEGTLTRRPDDLRAALDLFAPIHQRAKQAGLVLSLENCGVTVEEVFAVLDALDEPGYGLAWDCANEYPRRGSLPDAKGVAERVARTNCVHVKARGLVPGHGGDEAVPWADILHDLSESGFDGPVSIETHNKDRSLSNTEVSRRVLDHLRAAWPGGVDA